MGDSQTEAASIQSDIIRSLFSALDRPAYWLLGLVYQLFFNVASADLFANDTVMKFYGRVQLIIGVFMMFKLAMTIIKGIVNPDTFTDQKSGAGNLIYRIAVALILLTILVPINIPNARNEYEAQINNNGLLFGTLYSLQHRLLENNTLGRLILGTSDATSSNYVSTTSSRSENLKRASRIFTSTVLKGFYRINLLPEDQRTKHEDGKDDAVFNDNRVCSDIDDAILDAYTRVDAEPGEIISMVNLTCDSKAQPSYIPIISEVGGIIKSVKKITGNSKYIFAYMPFISAIVAFVFVFILLSFTVDVAVRAVKLAVLRLIAPIPIISYMDPNGGKDNAFNSWVKTLTTTYLDLFIRLAVVYFVIFLIEDMIINGVVINEANGVLGVLSTIIIWIGLFIFAKQAPKFIKSVLGLKDDGGKFFSGFGDILAAGSVGAGVVSGAVSNGVASRASGGNIGKSLVSGFIGGVGGGVNAGKAYFKSKDADAKSIMNANRAYNAKNYSNAFDDSTFSGRLKAGMQGNFGLRTDLEKFDQKVGRYQRAENAWKSIQNALDSDGWKGSTAADHVARGGYVAATAFSAGGETILTAGERYSVKDLKDVQGRMKASGRYSEAELKTMDGIVKAAEQSRFDYIRKQSKETLETPRERQVYEGAVQIMQTASKHASDSDGVWKDFNGHYDISDTYYDGKMGATFKGASYAAGASANEIKSSAEYAQAKANASRAEQSKK